MVWDGREPRAAYRVYDASGLPAGVDADELLDDAVAQASVGGGTRPDSVGGGGHSGRPPRIPAPADWPHPLELPEVPEGTTADLGARRAHRAAARAIVAGVAGAVLGLGGIVGVRALSGLIGRERAPSHGVAHAAEVGYTARGERSRSRGDAHLSSRSPAQSATVPTERMRERRAPARPTALPAVSSSLSSLQTNGTRAGTGAPPAAAFEFGFEQ